MNIKQVSFKLVVVVNTYDEKVLFERELSEHTLAIDTAPDSEIYLAERELRTLAANYLKSHVYKPPTPTTEELNQEANGLINKFEQAIDNISNKLPLDHQAHLELDESLSKQDQIEEIDKLDITDEEEAELEELFDCKDDNNDLDKQ